MLDLAQVDGGKALVDDVTSLKRSMHGDKVRVLDDQTDLNAALADLAQKVNAIYGKNKAQEESF